MKKLLILLLYAAFLSSCGAKQPSEEMIQTAIAETEAAKPVPTKTLTIAPSPTATEKPLADYKLNDLLVQENELPPGYNPSQISYIGIPFLAKEDLPEELFVIQQKFEHKNEYGGSVYIYVYEDPHDAELVHEYLVDSLYDENFVEATNEEGVHIAASFLDMTVKQVAITTHYCHYTTYIFFNDTTDIKSAATYAGSVDGRLYNELPCEE